MCPNNPLPSRVKVHEVQHFGLQLQKANSSSTDLQTSKAENEQTEKPGNFIFIRLQQQEQKNLIFRHDFLVFYPKRARDLIFTSE